MSIRYHEADHAAPARTRGHGVHRLVEYGLEWLASSLPVTAAVFYTAGRDGSAFAAPLAILSDDELDPRVLATAYHARGAVLDPFAPHCVAHSDARIVDAAGVAPAAYAA